jgi:hypothetical protein
VNSSASNSYVLTELSTKKFGDKQVVYDKDGSYDVLKRERE